jgi:HEAT repeat protein
MLRALLRLFPAVRPAEQARFAFFFSLMALLFLAQTVGLVGAEAIFLARRGSDALPAAFVIAACTTVAASLAYSAVVGRARNDGLFVALLAGGALFVAAAGLASLRGAGRAPLALFAAFFVLQAVLLNHYWTFAGDFFDTLASKRLFPLLMAGSSLGGALGGALAVVATRAAPPEALLAAWAAGLLAAAALIRILRPRIRKWGPLGFEEADESSVAGLRAALGFARRSAASRWLVLSALAMMLALFTSQYLYSEAFLARFSEPAALASFLGAFLLVSNGLELAVELWVTPWLIRRFGVASANLIHPLATLAAFAGLAVELSLGPAIAARLNREMLDNALGQPVRNLVYNALPRRLRGRMRAFLEGIVVYAGMAIAGTALLATAGGAGGRENVQLLCGLGAAAALLYLGANFGVRRAYLAALVDELRAGRLDLRDVGDALGDFEVAELAALWRELLAAPGAPSDLAAAARELAPVFARHGEVEPLAVAARHADTEVRRAAVTALATLGDADARAALLAALADPDSAVRVAAIRGLANPAGGGAPAGIRECLRDPDPEVCAEAALHLDFDGRAVLARMARHPAPPTALAALARIPAELAAIAHERAADRDAAIAAAALRALARLGAAESIPVDELVVRLSHPAEEVRLAALALLGAQPGPRVAQALAGALDDPARAVRAAAAERLGGLGDLGVEAARPQLASDRLWTQDAALVAIAAASTPLARAALREELRRLVADAWKHRLAFDALGDAAALAARFLRAAHASAFGERLRLAFRVLELLEGPVIVRSVQRTLRLGSPRAQADALEVLSNLGDREASGLLALLHESGALEDRIRGVGRFADRPRLPAEVVASSREETDPWVRKGSLAAYGTSLVDPEERKTMERLLALREIPLFTHLRLDQLDQVQRAMREESYVAGEVVVREGDPGSELYLLLEGAVDVYIDRGGPGERRVNQLAAVSWFGEMAVLDDETRTATIVVAKDARLASLSGDRLKELILAMPEISFEIFRELIARVRSAERRGREA